jgi:hypothetical protein
MSALQTHETSKKLSMAARVARLEHSESMNSIALENVGKRLGRLEQVCTSLTVGISEIKEQLSTLKDTIKSATPEPKSEKKDPVLHVRDIIGAIKTDPLLSLTATTLIILMTIMFFGSGYLAGSTFTVAPGASVTLQKMSNSKGNP